MWVVSLAPERAPREKPPLHPSLRPLRRCAFDRHARSPPVSRPNSLFPASTPCTLTDGTPHSPASVHRPSFPWHPPQPSPTHSNPIAPTAPRSRLRPTAFYLPCCRHTLDSLHAQAYFPAARQIKRSSFYYGPQNGVPRETRTPLGYHYRGEPYGPTPKVHAFSGRYGQLFLSLEEGN
jgi:hypothetical protein